MNVPKYMHIYIYIYVYLYVYIHMYYITIHRYLTVSLYCVPQVHAHGAGGLDYRRSFPSLLVDYSRFTCTYLVLLFESAHTRARCKRTLLYSLFWWFRCTSATKKTSEYNKVLLHFCTSARTETIIKQVKLHVIEEHEVMQCAALPHYCIA